MTHTIAILVAKKRWAQYAEHNWEDPESRKAGFSKTIMMTMRMRKNSIISVQFSSQTQL